MIRTYRSKPVTITAVQYDGKNWEEIISFTKGKARMALPGLVINTLEGEMLASSGDYIIRGTHGEFYPCKPEVFKFGYEEI